MKKLISLFVMAIYIISLVPAAFAIEDSNTTVQSNDTTVQGTDDSSNTPKVNARIKPMKVQRATFKERYQETRERFQKNKKLLRERLTKARERKKVAVQHHKEAKQNIQERRARLAACKDQDTEECKNLRKDTRKETKRYLLNIAEHVLSMIDKTEERVKNSNLDETQKSELLADLEAKAEEIASAMETIEGLTEDSSKEEFIEAARTIKEAWKELRHIIKKGIGMAANGKIHAISERLGNLKRKLHQIMDRLEDAGKDTSKAKPFLETFDEKLEEAKDARDRARSLYQEGKIEEAVKATKEANNALREAHKALKNFVRALKAIKGGEDALKGEAVAEDTEDAEDKESEETPVEEAEETGEEPEEGDENSDEESNDEGNETA